MPVPTYRRLAYSLHLFKLRKKMLLGPRNPRSEPSEPGFPGAVRGVDDIQERLRRELAFDKINYRYRPEAHVTIPGLDVMTIEEAAVAMAVTSRPKLPGHA